jgi:hypothetical protein
MRGDAAARERYERTGLGVVRRQRSNLEYRAPDPIAVADAYDVIG